MPDSERRFSSTTPPTELARAIRASHPDAWEALDLLSRLAMSGDADVREILNHIDQDVELGLIRLPAYPEAVPAEADPNLAFLLIHPILALKTKIRQVLVGLDHTPPPFTSTVEEFPNLPPYRAYIALVRGGQFPPPTIDWFSDDPFGLQKPPQLGDRPEHHDY